LRVKPLKIIAAFTSSSEKYHHQVTQLTYLCDYVSGQVKLNPKEHSEFHWLRKSQIKKFKLIHFVKDLMIQI